MNITAFLVAWIYFPHFGNVHLQRCFNRSATAKNGKSSLFFTKFLTCLSVSSVAYVRGAVRINLRI